LVSGQLGGAGDFEGLGIVALTFIAVAEFAEGIGFGTGIVDGFGDRGSFLKQGFNLGELGAGELDVVAGKAIGTAIGGIRLKQGG
jgi:hypothetical protein